MNKRYYKWMSAVLVLMAALLRSLLIYGDEAKSKNEDRKRMAPFTYRATH